MTGKTVQDHDHKSYDKGSVHNYCQGMTLLFNRGEESGTSIANVQTIPTKLASHLGKITAITYDDKQFKEAGI